MIIKQKYLFILYNNIKNINYIILEDVGLKYNK